MNDTTTTQTEPKGGQALKAIAPEQRSELIRQIAIMRAGGKTWHEAASQAGVTAACLLHWRRYYAAEWKARYDEAVALVGERPHQHYTKPKPATIAEAAKMHAQGASKEQIAERLKVKVSRVEFWRASCKEHWDAVYIAEKQPFDAPLVLPPKSKSSTPPRPLLWWAENQLYKLRTNIRREKTKDHYRASITEFSRYLGRTATQDDLTDEVLTGWLNKLLEKLEGDKPRSIETLGSHVERVRALWRFLNDRGIVSTRPTFSIPAYPAPTPVALDDRELTRLFEAAMCRPGFVAGVPARYWWPALFGFIFCTSERKGATLAMKWSHVNLETGSVSIPAGLRKGGVKPGTYKLWDEVRWLLSRIVQPKRELVFAWEKSECSLYKAMGRILIDAQIPNDRKHKLHSLRVTHNTWTKCMTGNHSPLLMHADPGTSARHYEDFRFTVREPVKLPIVWRTPEPDNPLHVATDDDVRTLPRAKVLQ